MIGVQAMNINEFKQKYSDSPQTILTILEDWQTIALREANELLGTPEGSAKLAEARRYEFMLQAYKHLFNMQLVKLEEEEKCGKNTT
jgi:hypothetical protein